MKTEDIIRMAREAGFNVEQGYLLRITGIDEDLERFAALVAAAEREECAGLAERRMLIDKSKDRRIGHHHACQEIATDIRARGQA